MRIKILKISPLNTAKYSFLLLFTLLSFCAFSAPSSSDGEEFDAGEMIMHHISDAHEWHLFDIGETSVTIPLPVILYVPGEGPGNFHVQSV